MFCVWLNAQPCCFSILDHEKWKWHQIWSDVMWSRQVNHSQYKYISQWNKKITSQYLPLAPFFAPNREWEMKTQGWFPHWAIATRVSLIINHSIVIHKTHRRNVYGIDNNDGMSRWVAHVETVVRSYWHGVVMAVSYPRVCCGGFCYCCYCWSSSWSHWQHTSTYHLLVYVKSRTFKADHGLFCTTGVPLHPPPRQWRHINVHHG